MQTQDTASDVRYVNPVDRFSMQRVKMVARFYYPTFRTQLWLYPLVGFLVGLLYHVKEFFSIIDFFYYLLTMAMGFMIYWAPIVMTGKQRTTEILLPARWSEKALVLIIYFFVVVPVLVYGANLIGSSLVSIFRFGEFRLYNEVTETALSKLATSRWTYFPLSYFNILLPISIFLFTVCRSVRPKAWQGILWSVVSTFTVGISVGVFVVVKVVSKLDHLRPGFLDEQETENMVMSMIDFNLLFALISGVLVVSTVVFTLLTIRSIRRVQA